MLPCTRKEKKGAVLVLIIISLIIVFNTDWKSTSINAKYHLSYRELASRTRFACIDYSSSSPKFARPRNLSSTVIFNPDNIINTFQFAFPINVAKRECNDREVQVVMPVHSALTNFYKRSRIRLLSQGKYSKIKSHKVLLLFFVGLPPSEYSQTDHDMLQNALNEESKEHGDIIQADIVDTYANIVYKSLAVLQWVSQYCPRAEFVIKTDDDVFVHVPRLILSLYKIQHMHIDFIVGNRVTDAIPNRSKDENRYVPEDEYRRSTYPPFAESPAIGFPTSTGLLLYQQALRTKLMRLHDVFLTGICAQRLGIPVFHDINYALVHRVMKDPNANSHIYSTAKSINANV